MSNKKHGSKLIGNSILMLVLLGILALPITSLGMMKLATIENVLSEEDIRLPEDTPETTQAIQRLREVGR